MRFIRIVFWLIGTVCWVVITHNAYVRLESADLFLAFDVLIACGVFTLKIAILLLRVFSFYPE